jgi:DNA-binding transcriptional LysR family regulator
MAFFERSKSVMQALDEAAEAVAGRRGLAGTVRLALPMSFGHLHVVPALTPFLREHRELLVQMDLDDRHVDLVQGGYDLAVRIGTLADSSLVARRLATSRRVLCCSPAYLAGRTPPRMLEDLAAHDCIGYGLVASSHIWQFQPADAGAASGRVATTVRARIVANNGEAMLQAALQGLGLTVLPAFLVCDHLRAGRLVELRLDGLAPTTDPIHAVYTQARNLSSKVRAIIDVLAAAWAGDAPPWDRT